MAPQRLGVRRALPELGAVLALSVLFAALLEWTRGRTYHLVVDFGREVFVPWRLAEGEHLYRDIAWFNGPFAAYLNALLFRILGPSIVVVERASAVLLAASTAALYRYLRRRTDLLTATACTALFLSLFGFGLASAAGNYNWLTPYSYDATYGLLLSVLAVGLTFSWSAEPSYTKAGGAGVAVGLACLTKPEFVPPVIVACALAVWLLRPGTEAGARRRKVYIAICLGTVVATLAGAWAALAAAMPLRTASSGILGGWSWILNGTATSLSFYQEMSGWPRRTENLRIAGEVIGTWFLVLGAAALLAWRSGRLSRRTTRILWAAVPGLSGLLVALFGWRGWLFAGRPLPLALLVVAGGAAWLIAKNGRGDRSCQLVLVWSTFATLLLPKIFLRVGFDEYGFVLAAPATVLMTTLLLHTAPRWIDSRKGNGTLFRQLVVALLAALVLAHGARLALIHRLQSTAVQIDGARLLTDRRGEVFTRVATDLRRLAPADATLVVLPEGALLNLATHLDNPTRFVNFMPPELAFFGEEEILRDFSRHPPTFVVLVHRPTNEYGVSRFGQDYGKTLWEWIAERYDLVKVYGQSPMERSSDFGMALWKRAAAAPSQM